MQDQIPRGMRSKRGDKKGKVPFLPTQKKQTKPPKKPGTDRDKLPRGLQIDTTTGEGANITKMRQGGMCRGAGAAIKGTKFEGVF
jgi:hypothetical protein